jgi:hypothetical protein
VKIRKNFVTIERDATVAQLTLRLRQRGRRVVALK